MQCVQVFPTRRAIDVYKFMLIQMMNKNVLLEHKKDLIDFFICLLNKVRVPFLSTAWIVLVDEKYLWYLARPQVL